MRIVDKIVRKFSIFVSLLAIASFAGAEGTSVGVPAVSSYADTESITNVMFFAGGDNDRLLTISLELDASSSNNVSVAFGTDSNGNGVLEREEMDLELGWDSGAWFYHDRCARFKVETPRADARRSLNWRLTLRPDRTAKSLRASDVDGVVFPSAVPPTMFDPDWNLMRVVARGLSEPDGTVVSAISGWGFKVIFR